MRIESSFSLSSSRESSSDASSDPSSKEFAMVADSSGSSSMSHVPIALSFWGSNGRREGVVVVVSGDLDAPRLDALPRVGGERMLLGRSVVFLWSREAVVGVTGVLVGEGGWVIRGVRGGGSAWVGTRSA